MTQNSLDDKICYVANKFAASNIKVEAGWLSGCIEFFCSEDPRISNQSLYENAREQWLLADLNEVGEGCLPETVKSKKEEFVLDKMYPVQLQWLLDCSESCYDQLRNIYDKKLDEGEESNEFNTTSYNRNEIKKNRVLKLELTDGKITTQALEYNPVACLTTKLTPGCKILLKGPMRCINKILFLEPKNVQILGGEVDTLLIENSYENILLKQLGKPINSNPKIDYKESIVIERKNPPITIPLAEQTSFVANRSPEGQNIQNRRKFTATIENHADVIMDDDDFLLDINLDEIENRAVFMAQPQLNQPSPKKTRPIVLEEDEQFLEDLDVLNDIENQIQNERNIQTERRIPDPPAQASPEKKKNNTFDDFVDHSNFFDSSMDFEVTDVETDVVPKSKTILDDHYEFKVDGINLATTDQLLKYKRDELEGKKFILFCEIDSVPEKLQIKNCEYCLGVFLKDYTEKQIQARFHTEVLSKLAEYTPQELQLMRQTEKERPHFKNQINQILTKLKTVLQELKCFMKISYNKNGKNDFPVIIDLIYINDTDTNTLNRKRKCCIK